MDRSSMTRALRGFALPLCLLLGGGVALALPAGASAAESIYWTNGQKIEVGTVGGSSETAAKSLYESLADDAGGLALDPAASKLFFSEPSGGAVLDGAIAAATAGEKLTPTSLVSGATSVDGVAVDAATSTLYWSVPETGEIFSGSLNSGATAITKPEAIIKAAAGITGIAIDPTDGDIYWANATTGEIYYAALTGGSYTALYNSLSAPEGLAIDSTTDEIYWTESGNVVAAPVSPGTPSALYKGQTGATAIAVDPSTNDLYWSDAAGIVAGSTSGSSQKSLYTTGASSEGLALLDPPVSAGAATISGTPKIGETLTCAAAWDADLPESQLYEAPAKTEYVWLHDKTAIKGATSSTWKVTEGGSITCEGKAENAAGTTTSKESSVENVPIPAPTVTISTPTSGGTYTEHETVETKFSCKAGAGGTITSCADSNGIAGTISGGTSASGKGDIDTAVLGAGTYTVTVVSDGQTATASVTYTVVPYASLAATPEISIEAIGKTVTSKKQSVTLACSEGAACAGKVSITAKAKVKVTVKKGKKKTTKTKTETLTLASGSYSLAAGKSETLKLALSSKAIAALQAAKGEKLTATVKVTVTGGETASETATIKLAAKAKKSKTKKKASTGKKS